MVGEGRSRSGLLLRRSSWWSGGEGEELGMGGRGRGGSEGG